MPLNTRDHQKTKKVTPRAGQLFETTNPEWPSLIGWIARDDLVVGPVRNAFLIYIFKPEIKELNFSTRQDFVKALLLPPLITDITLLGKKSLLERQQKLKLRKRDLVYLLHFHIQ